MCPDQPGDSPDNSNTPIVPRPGAHRGPQLVRPAEPRGDARSAIGNAGQSGEPEPERDHRAARMMQAIEEGVAEARVRAAHQFGQFGGVAGDRLQQLRDRLRENFTRSRLRVRQLASEHPGQIIAVIAGVSFACGVTLLLRNARRR